MEVYQKKSVKELDNQLKMNRVPVSISGTELLSFVLEHQPKDFLIVKPPDNPFKPKSTCMFL